jgi:hypothetical protein
MKDWLRHYYEGREDELRAEASRLHGSEVSGLEVDTSGGIHVYVPWSAEMPHPVKEAGFYRNLTAMKEAQG